MLLFLLASLTTCSYVFPFASLSPSILIEKPIRHTWRICCVVLDEERGPLLWRCTNKWCRCAIWHYQEVSTGKCFSLSYIQTFPRSCSLTIYHREYDNVRVYSFLCFPSSFFPDPILFHHIHQHTMTKVSIQFTLLFSSAVPKPKCYIYSTYLSIASMF